MKLILSLVFLFHCFSEGLKKDHAVYIGVVEIVRGEENKASQVRFKVFADDLEDALRNFSKETINQDEETNCGIDVQQLTRYFETYFECTINGQLVSFDYLKCEKNSESVWLSFELSAFSDWEEIMVKADFFMELFPAQVNVISINNGDQKKFLRLDKKTPSGRVNFTD